MNTYYFSLLASIFVLPLAIAGSIKVQAPSHFKSTISPIPLSIQKKMRHYSWKKNCPVSLQTLVLVKLTYWGFDKKPHEGALIIHKALATEVVAIFKTLYQQKFPIWQMKLIDKYKGDDNTAMAANNTSAFNCRNVTGQPTMFSQHSYGRAIDINPLINPYVQSSAIYPSAGKSFVNRKKNQQGKIKKNDLAYQEFKKYGWDWGGDWLDVQDYQHFEKRKNGQKRPPYGYSKEVLHAPTE